MPQAIREAAAGLDLSSRLFTTTTVVGSPAANAETIVASLTIPQDLVVASGVALVAWCAFTVGTSGVTADLKIRQTNASGSTVGDTGATTAAAATLVTRGCLGFDTAAVLPGQVYVATLTIGSGGAVSTVSAVRLFAVVI